MKTFTFMFAMFCANLLSISMLFGSDHSDAPLARDNPYANIADVYAFMDGDKLIVVLTVYPDLPECVADFSNDVTYKIYIDTDGDAKEEFTFIYNKVTGFSGNLFPLVNRLFLGRRDDPFFIDVPDMNGMLDGVDDNLDEDIAAIVLEIPKALVAISGPVVGVWATTEKPGIPTGGGYVDRMGKPLVNSLFTLKLDDVEPFFVAGCGITNLKGNSNNLFNRIPPEFDLNPIFPPPPPPQIPNACQTFGAGVLLLDGAFKTGIPFDAIPFILGIKGQNEGDVLRIDTSNPNSSFPNSGRALKDDVVDIIGFFANTFNPLLPITDNLNNNDVPFLPNFPYLAKPHKLCQVAKTFDDEGQETSTIPDDFELGQAYPNPFNPSTSINYALPTNGTVSLKVYNVIGEEIRTLVNVSQAAGRYSVTWDGKDNSGREVASGIYIYRIDVSSPSQTGSFSQSRRMSLLK